MADPPRNQNSLSIGGFMIEKDSQKIDLEDHLLPVEMKPPKMLQVEIEFPEVILHSFRDILCILSQHFYPQGQKIHTKDKS
jgi:hypothetical protein